MNTVWKYRVPIKERFELEMPLGAKVLSLQLMIVRERYMNRLGSSEWQEIQRPFIWALVDSKASMRARVFYFTFTGDDVTAPPDSLEFIGTVQFTDTGLGTIVWHLFEIPCLEHAPPLPAPNQDTQSKDPP